MKKTLTMILSLALTLSLAVPAFAAADKTITGTGDESYTKETQLPLVGEITDSAVLISVVMPTSMAFTIGTESVAQTVIATGTNTTAAAQGNKFSTLISGTGTVTNNSNKPIKLDIVGVADTQELLKKVDLALAAGDDISLDAAMANKLALTASETPIPLAERIAASGSSVALNVFGKGLTGQYSGQDYPVNLGSGNYTVTTTLKVSIAA